MCKQSHSYLIGGITQYLQYSQTARRTMNYLPLMMFITSGGLYKHWLFYPVDKR